MSVTAPMPTDRPQTCLIQGHHPHPAVAQVRGDVLHYELSEVFEHLDHFRVALLVLVATRLGPDSMTLEQPVDAALIGVSSAMLG